MSGMNEDNLFLSTQAKRYFNLSKAILGKVEFDEKRVTSDSILFISYNEPHVNDLNCSPKAVLCMENNNSLNDIINVLTCPIIVVENGFIFSDGDVISISPKGRIHREYRVASKNNALLVTETCNNLCIMCPQPPKPENPAAYKKTQEKIQKVLSLIEKRYNPDSLCITGGEPTMLRKGLISIVESISRNMPETLIHLLSNGRYLCREDFTAELAFAAKGNMLVGIPLFAHVSDIHDYVVQCEGAFDQTMAGLLNCYKYGIPIELRIVINKATVPYLHMLSEYIAKNLFFVKHVALMGMENMGFAKLNRNEVFIDPWCYKDALSNATRILQLYGIDTRIFNLPLCVVNEDSRQFCAKSISDFKRIYYPECDDCAKREDCCGFFSSSTEKFYLTRHATPFFS